MPSHAPWAEIAKVADKKKAQKNQRLNMVLIILLMNCLFILKNNRTAIEKVSIFEREKNVEFINQISISNIYLYCSKLIRKIILNIC